MSVSVIPWPQAGLYSHEEQIREVAEAGIKPGAIHVHACDGIARFYVGYAPSLMVLPWPESANPTVRVEIDHSEDVLVLTILANSLTGNSDICLGEALLTPSGRLTWPTSPAANVDAEVLLALVDGIRNLAQMPADTTATACERSVRIFAHLHWRTEARSWHIPWQGGWIRVLRTEPFCPEPDSSPTRLRASVVSDGPADVCGHMTWTNDTDLAFWDAFTRTEHRGKDLPGWTTQLTPLLPHLSR